MKMTPSFFHSLDDWVDDWSVDEIQGLDSTSLQYTVDSYYPCPSESGSGLHEDSFADTPDFDCNVKPQRAGGLQ